MGFERISGSSKERPRYGVGGGAAPWWRCAHWNAAQGTRALGISRFPALCLATRNYHLPSAPYKLIFSRCRKHVSKAIFLRRPDKYFCLTRYFTERENAYEIWYSIGIRKPDLICIKIEINLFCGILIFYISQN